MFPIEKIKKILHSNKKEKRRGGIEIIVIKEMVKELSREYKMTLFSVFNRGKKGGEGN